jgi:hypothetical protein
MFVSSVTVYGVPQLLMRDDLAGGCREGARCREPASPLNLANRLAVCPPNPHRWQMEAPGVRTTIRLMSCTHHPYSGFGEARAPHREGRE